MFVLRGCFVGGLWGYYVSECFICHRLRYFTSLWGGFGGGLFRSFVGVSITCVVSFYVIMCRSLSLIVICVVVCRSCFKVCLFWSLQTYTTPQRTFKKNLKNFLFVGGVYCVDVGGCVVYVVFV